MANVHQGFGGSPQAWYASLPPITKLYGTACVATTVATMLGLASPVQLYLSWPAIIGRLQIWRLLTSFVYLGGPSFNLLLRIIWIVQYGGTLESQTFRFSTADFVYMLLVGIAALLAVSVAVPVAFPGPSLIFMMVYVWSRNFPNNNISLMGLVTLQAFWLPFAMLALSLVMGGNWVSDALGILAGHLYYFLKELHPAAGGGRYLETPHWLKKLLLRAGVGNVNVREVRMEHPSDPRFRSFGGTPRRLNE